MDLIAEWLTKRRGQAVKFLIPKKGQKERLVELAQKNAKLVLDQDKDKIKREEWDKNKEYDRLGLEDQYTEFLGNKVVCHNIPVRPGRNLAVIVESAAVNYRQKKMGYNAAQELYNRVQANIAKRGE